jgi:transposase-like protein
MKNKNENSYITVFEKLKEILKITANYIIIDFENALLNSIKKVFQNAMIKGCSFHFGQSIWRKVQSVGLSDNI